VAGTTSQISPIWHANNLDFGPTNSYEEFSENVAAINSHPSLVYESAFDFGPNNWGPQDSSFDFQPNALPGSIPSVEVSNGSLNNNAENLWFQQPVSFGMIHAAQNNFGYLPSPALFDPAAPQDFIAQGPAAPVDPQALGIPVVPSAHPCTQIGCPATFRRPYERARHETAVHGINRVLHHCPIVGCPRSQGTGYSRADKVKEHLWKKHADLGYTKSR